MFGEIDNNFLCSQYINTSRNIAESSVGASQERYKEKIFKDECSYIEAEIGEVYDCFIFAVSGYLCSALEEKKKYTHLVMSAYFILVLYCSRNGHDYMSYSKGS